MTYTKRLLLLLLLQMYDPEKNYDTYTTHDW